MSFLKPSCYRLYSHRYLYHLLNNQSTPITITARSLSTKRFVEMPASNSVKLNTGASMPTLGLGTWKSEPEKTTNAVKIALKTGYRSIDTATAYGNENEVGQGIKDSGVPREEFFLTTKLNNTDHNRASEALEKSLKWLQTDYLDLWLMHWPAPMRNGKADKEWNWLDTWRAMEDLYIQNPGKLKAIGVSNVSVPYMKELLKICRIVPAVNQIEIHAANNQQDIVDFCTEKGIVLTAYSPLGSGHSSLMDDPTITRIAKKYSVSPAIVLTSLQANKPNVTVLTKSVTPERIIDNFKLIDLTDEEVAELVGLEKTKFFRVCKPGWTGWGDLGLTDRIPA